MVRFIRQVARRAAPEEDRGAVALRAHVEAVHAARRDEDRIVRAEAAGDAAHRYPPLAAREPQEQRFGQRAHRLDPPTAAGGETRDRNDPRGRRRRALRHRVDAPGARLFRRPVGELRQRRAGKKLQRPFLGSRRSRRDRPVFASARV